MILEQSDVQIIVDDLKEVIKHDINFVDRQGIMIASTNSNRIGIKHAAALNCIKVLDKVIIKKDDENDIYREGINSPIIINGYVVGAISINGLVEEVSQYIDIVTKMTQIYINGLTYEKQKSESLIKDKHLIESVMFNQDMFNTKIELELLNVKVEEGCCVAIIEVKDTLLDVQKLYSTLITMQELKLISTVVGKRIVCICQGNDKNDLNAMFKSIAKKVNDLYNTLIQCSIGNVVHSEIKLHESYKNARLTHNSIDYNDNLIVFYEDIRFEVIISSLDADVKNNILDKTINKIEESKRDEYALILLTYFADNNSIEKSSKKLYIHKNTIQYRLDRIREKTGYNPRVFEEATFLYIAVLIYNQMKVAAD